MKQAGDRPLQPRMGRTPFATAPLEDLPHQSEQMARPNRTVLTMDAEVSLLDYIWAPLAVPQFLCLTSHPLSGDHNHFFLLRVLFVLVSLLPLRNSFVKELNSLV